MDARYPIHPEVFCCGGSWLAPEDLLVEGQWGEIEARILSAVALLNG